MDASQWDLQSDGRGRGQQGESPTTYGSPTTDERAARVRIVGAGPGGAAATARSSATDRSSVTSPCLRALIPPASRPARLPVKEAGTNRQVVTDRRGP